MSRGSTQPARSVPGTGRSDRGRRPRRDARPERPRGGPRQVGSLADAGIREAGQVRATAAAADDPDRGSVLGRQRFPAEPGSVTVGVEARRDQPLPFRDRGSVGRYRRSDDPTSYTRFWRLALSSHIVPRNDTAMPNTPATTCPTHGNRTFTWRLPLPEARGRPGPAPRSHPPGSHPRASRTAGVPRVRLSAAAARGGLGRGSRPPPVAGAVRGGRRRCPRSRRRSMRGGRPTQHRSEEARRERNPFCDGGPRPAFGDPVEGVRADPIGDAQVVQALRCAPRVGRRLPVERVERQATENASGGVAGGFRFGPRLETVGVHSATLGDESARPAASRPRRHR